jgi:hypothetical protein
VAKLGIQYRRVFPLKPVFSQLFVLA